MLGRRGFQIRAVGTRTLLRTYSHSDDPEEKIGDQVCSGNREERMADATGMWSRGQSIQTSKTEINQA